MIDITYVHTLTNHDQSFRSVKKKLTYLGLKYLRYNHFKFLNFK